MSSILNKDILNKALEDILKDYDNITYKLFSSKSTDSSYIKLIYKNTYRFFRISNHNSNTNITTLIIYKNTKLKTLKAFIHNNIKKLIKKGKK